MRSVIIIICIRFGKMGKIVIGKVCPGIKNRTGALVAAGAALVSINE